MAEERPAHPTARPRALFADPDFRRVWLSGALAGTMRWMEILTAAVVTFQLTRSALMVAVVLFLRTLPMLLLGLVSGTIADRIDRQKLILAMLLLLTAVEAALAGFALAGALAVWQLGAAAFCSGLYWTTEHPGRRALLGEIAGPDRLGRAMGFDSSTINLTRLVGPTLGGFVLERSGFAATAALAAIVYAAAAVAMARVRHRREGGPSAERGRILAGLAEGFRYVKTDRKVIAVLLATIAMNTFAFPYSSMVAPIGEQQLHLGPTAIGLLVSAEATGATLFSLALAWIGRPGWYVRTLFWGSLLFLVMILAFSFSRSYPLSLALLFVGGFGFAGFATMQSTVLLAQAPAAIRSRVMGMLTLCIGAGPIGVLMTGFIASAWGAASAVTIIATAGLVSVGALTILIPEARRADPCPAALARRHSA